MYPRNLVIPFVILATLVVAAGLVLARHFQSQPPPQEAREFQRLVGGLGFGPALDLRRCAFSFDPRLCPGCQEDLGPIPGGAYFCPHHACSIFFYPSLDRERDNPGK
jgi:hypothetical protein